MNVVRELRRLNLEGHARTDVENLFLLEMATSDYRDLFKESTELDMIMSNDQIKLFDDTISFENDGEDGFAYSSPTIDPSSLTASDYF